MRRVGWAWVAAAGLAVVPAWPADAQTAPERRVVVFALPGVTWGHIASADMPNLDGLIRRGAVGSVSVRSAQRGTTPLRGYLTMGAGARVATPRRAPPRRDDPQGQVALPADAHFEEGTAALALQRRTGARVRGGIVQPAMPYLRGLDRRQLFVTQLGALGSALGAAGVPRAVVTAGDLAVKPREESMRRSAVLALADAAGWVDAGTVSGLVRADPGAPFGVSTDPAGFEAAARDALAAARVVLLDPGETLRADEFAFFTTPERSGRYRREGLERADALLGRVVGLLRPGDQLYVIAPSSPVNETLDHLTPIVAGGLGVPRGWLTSPATRRDGLVALTDVAPTILADLGLDVPASMRGTRIRPVAARDAGRLSRLAALDRDSLFRERFLPIVTGIVIGLLAFIAVLSFLAFLLPRRPGHRALRTLAYAALALAPAGLILRAVGISRAGVAVATLALAGLVTVFVVIAFLVPGPRWAAGVVLLLFSCTLLAADMLAGAPLALSGVFGYSPTVGGRFYGNGNLGYAILFAAGILGVTGLGDLLGHQRATVWAGVALAALVVIEGVPQFGADLGGVLSGVPAVAVTWVIARGRRIRWQTAAVLGVAAVALSAAAVVVDAFRPAEVQTHLGRFGSQVVSGDLGAVWAVVRRKGLENLNLLDSTAWLYTIPIAVSVLALLLWRPRGVLAEELPKHPLLRAGLIGSLVAGVGGFLVNDSGIIITAMVLVHVVPFFVLIGLQPRSRTVPA